MKPVRNATALTLILTEAKRRKIILKASMVIVLQQKFWSIVEKRWMQCLWLKVKKSEVIASHYVILS